MSATTSAGRLLTGLAIAVLLVGCAAGGGSTAGGAAPAAAATGEASAPSAIATPSHSAAPTATAPPPTPSPVYDASTAVSIHIEAPECLDRSDRPPTTTFVNGVRQMRDGGKRCRYEGADPRFSGWSDIVVDSDCYMADDARCVRWGTERIPGPDGDWVGSLLGGQFGGGIRFDFEVLVGTGAYEGWTYVAYTDMTAEAPVIDGFIYQGPPPPLPTLPAPRSPVYDASTAVDIHLQEGDPPDWACDTDPDRPPEWTSANGVQHIRDGGRRCLYDGADPRFSGWSYIVHNADIYSPGEDRSKVVFWGTERIPGPHGDWVGPYWGGSIGTGSGWRGHFAVLEGTGAYEGWTFVRYMDMAALGGQEWVVDGLIYRGPPPPVPPLTSPSSD